MKKFSVVLFSYIPLLRAEDFPDLDHIPPEEITNIIDRYESFTKGCIWMDKNGEICPVFLLENAKEIYDHFNSWSDEKPQNWFDVQIKTKDGKYAIVLVPRIKNSIDRWKTAYQLRNLYPPPQDTIFNVLFKPLNFVSGKKTIFSKIKSKIKKEISIGFADVKDFDYDNVNSWDSNKILWTNKLKVTKDKSNNDFINNLIDDSKEPSKKSKIF